MLTTTHLTYYYTFLPTKDQETTLNNSTQNPYEPDRSLVEIRDIYDPPIIDPIDPWVIKKRITYLDLISGRITLTHEEVFEHVLRHWTVSFANNVVMHGHRMPMLIWDHTHRGTTTPPRKCIGDNIYFEKGPNDTFFLGWTDVATSNHVNPCDEIGLFWGIRNIGFHFNILRRRE